MKALSFLLAQGMRVEPRPRCVFIDKDRGGEIFVRAMGGRYERLSPGEPTGFAPLQLEDTPAQLEVKTLGGHPDAKTLGYIQCSNHPKTTNGSLKFL